MADHADIKALIDRYEAAIGRKDAKGAIACLAADAVAYDLAPPLEIGPADLHDPDGLEQWFATWRGPIQTSGAELTLRVAGDVGYAFALRCMTGEKVSGGKVDLWFRVTMGFARRDGRWLIAHVHNSVPFAMDGSERALLDLKP